MTERISVCNGRASVVALNKNSLKPQGCLGEGRSEVDFGIPKRGGGMLAP